MALVLNDRVKETTAVTGIGPATLTGAPVGFETFASGVGGLSTTYYAIVFEGASPAEWEVGLGTLNGAGTILTRTTPITSSNSDALVVFTGVGSDKSVFCTLPASKAVYLDANGVPVGAASNGFAVAMAIAL